MLEIHWGFGRISEGRHCKPDRTQLQAELALGRPWSHVLPALTVWFALLLDREKQESGENSVMAALVRWDHGERRGEEAALGSG